MFISLLILENVMFDLAVMKVSSDSMALQQHSLRVSGGFFCVYCFEGDCQNKFGDREIHHIIIQSIFLLFTCLFTFIYLTELLILPRNN